MNLTDLFIKRPVLAVVVSLLIFVVGLASISHLALRQYPELEVSTIEIDTSYSGADQSLIQGFVTSPIEQAVSGVEGIDYVEASSTTGSSVVTVHLNLGYPINTAINDINAQLQAIRYKLPSAVQDPVVMKGGMKGNGLVYIAYYSDVLTAEQITDYLNRAIVPEMETLDGIAAATVLGARTYSMRIWLSPLKMTALGISTDDVVNALTKNNVQAAPGDLTGRYDDIAVTTTTDLHTEEQFNNIVIRTEGDTFIRIKDIGEAKLGPEDTNFNIKAQGRDAVVLEIDALSTANTLSVAKEVLHLLPNLEKELPPGLSQQLLYDASQFIKQSIHAVIETLIEATIIVLFVIFLFLGTIRAVIIPVVTIPLSLVGLCFFLMIFGYSLNVLTLLAMILAIGLVVDDAIVVLENINRHIELGETPFAAAMRGAREIAMPVISMSTTLAAVFIPIGFMGGLTGGLFTEFAFALAASVILSGVIALTLSPMMCSRMMTHHQLESRFVHRIDAVLGRITRVYRYLLQGTLNARPVVLLFTLVVLIACFVLYATTQQELAPQEDQGFILAASQGPTNANIDYTTLYMSQVSKVLQTVPEKVTDMSLIGMQGINTGFSFLVLTPANQRKRSAEAISMSLQEPLSQVTGMQNFMINPPTLPGTPFGAPVKFVLTSLGSYDSLNNVANAIIEKAQQTHLFFYLRNDLSIDKPEFSIDIHRDLLSDMGMNAETIANSLSTFLGGGTVNWFNYQGRSYRVIPQVYARDRWNPSNVQNFYVNTGHGLVPLSSLVTLTASVEPNGLSEFQQKNSAVIEAQPFPGVSMGTALSALQSIAEELMPEGMTYDYMGQSRQYTQQDNMVYIFVFALIFIFLILAAQFESFREPFIILISVPTAICGALIFLNIGLGTINIFTEIALITLIGLIAKQGILIVEFANQCQLKEGLSIQDAVLKAACTRLRPILMTTAAMVFGALPLMLATEGLVHSQRQLALVIITGMLLGTLMTIFIVPVFYTLLAEDKQKSQKKLDQLLSFDKE